MTGLIKTNKSADKHDIDETFSQYMNTNDKEGDKQLIFQQGEKADISAK